MAAVDDTPVPLTPWEYARKIDGLKGEKLDALLALHTLAVKIKTENASASKKDAGLKKALITVTPENFRRDTGGDLLALARKHKLNLGTVQGADGRMVPGIAFEVTPKNIRNILRAQYAQELNSLKADQRLMAASRDKKQEIKYQRHILEVLEFRHQLEREGKVGQKLVDVDETYANRKNAVLKQIQKIEDSMHNAASNQIVLVSNEFRNFVLGANLGAQVYNCDKQKVEGNKIVVTQKPAEGNLALALGDKEGLLASQGYMTKSNILRLLHLYVRVNGLTSLAPGNVGVSHDSYAFNPKRFAADQHMGTTLGPLISSIVDRKGNLMNPGNLDLLDLLKIASMCVLLSKKTARDIVDGKGTVAALGVNARAEAERLLAGLGKLADDKTHQNQQLVASIRRTRELVDRQTADILQATGSLDYCTDKENKVHADRRAADKKAYLAAHPGFVKPNGRY
jgi:hypothetical protein